MRVIVPLPDCETEAVIEPGIDVATYDVMVELPLEVGAVNEMVALVPVRTVATPIVGAPGTVSTGGVTYVAE